MHVGNSPDACNCGIGIDGKEFETVDKFCYLGSMVASDGSISEEIKRRIGMSLASFQSLKCSLWKRKEISVAVKMRVFRAIVLSRLLYGAETWPLLAGDLQRLEAFQMFCLRRILRISWMDHVNNTTVRERCQQPSMEALLRQKRLRWLGHVQRMDIQVRLPKQLLWGRLSEGMRRQGGHKKRWIDVCMQDLKDCGVLCSWKDTCLNRHEWANIVRAEVGVTKKEILRQQKKPNDALNIDNDVVDGVGLSVPESDMPNETLMCPVCNRVCSREKEIVRDMVVPLSVQKQYF